MGYFPLQWQGAFDLYGNQVDGLSDFDSLMMIRATEELGRQLAQGDRVACYVGRDGLKDIPPFAFSHEGTYERLLKGRVLHFDLDSEIFIREASYLPPRMTSDQPVNEVKSGAVLTLAVTPQIKDMQSKKTLSCSAPRKKLTKSELEQAWSQFVNHFVFPDRPNRDARRQKYKELGITVVRGEQLHKELSPSYWKQTNNRQPIVN